MHKLLFSIPIDKKLHVRLAKNESNESIPDFIQFYSCYKHTHTHTQRERERDLALNNKKIHLTLNNKKETYNTVY